MQQKLVVSSAKGAQAEAAMIKQAQARPAALNPKPLGQRKVLDKALKALTSLKVPLRSLQSFRMLRPAEDSSAAEVASELNVEPPKPASSTRSA